MAAAVEHNEDGKATGCLCRLIRVGRLEDDDARHVAVAHGDVSGRFGDIFGPV